VDLKREFLEMTDVLENLYMAVLKADPDLAKEAAKEAMAQKIDPMEAVENGLVRGIKEVGERFGREELFLTDLVMGAEAFKAGLQIIQPELAKRKVEMKTLATMVIGTVAGDIHSIGKDIVTVLLSANGFKMHDLGVDVPVDRFIETAKEVKANVVGASAMMSTTIPEQQRIVEALKRAQLRGKAKFIVGGAAVSENWAKQIGADAYALAAGEAVQKAKSLLVHLADM